MKILDVSHAELLEMLDYDRKTGVFIWRYRRGSAAAGKRAGNISKETGRRIIQVAGSFAKASRLAWFYTHGVWPIGEIDHKDCDVSNDSIDNLRECDRHQNAWNMRTFTRTSTGYKGVRESRAGNYEASICFKGNRLHLGTFNDPIKAHGAYVAKARELFGEFARAA